MTPHAAERLYGMPQARRTIVRARHGFSFIEMLVAFAFMSLLMAIGTPKLLALRDRGAVRSAKQQINGYLVSARAAAMRQGTAATFHVSGDSVWVTGEEPNGAISLVGNPVQLSSEYSVSLASEVSTVRYNSRGFATNLLSNQVFRVTRAGVSDSVCVSRLGTITSQCGF